MRASVVHVSSHPFRLTLLGAFALVAFATSCGGADGVSSGGDAKGTGGASGTANGAGGAGSAGEVGGGSPFDSPPTCTSKTTWTQGDAGSSQMKPGTACIACHAMPNGPKAGPLFVIAGTLYMTGHEPDDCFGGPVPSASMPKIEVTDAQGKVISLPITMSGNFYYMGDVAAPFTAKVIYEGRARAMTSPQTSGDCNTCHTQSGANGALGRIVLP
jgi:hypothetical protein